MRAVLTCALALLAVTALTATLSAPVPGCGTGNDYTSEQPHRPKASSFAPHAAAPNRVYGMPIQQRILKSHPKKSPQLKSTPLPEG
ncbi:MAG: hypothetical protein JO299_03855 [Gammaproteobacteria bacterium]|nr:hypothetical protein [Gammaproteobacteria bacterium]